MSAAPVVAPQAPIVAPQPPIVAPQAPRGHRLAVAAHGDLGALAELRRCTTCGEGIVPAPPAPRVCDQCGAVGILPSYLSTPTRFLDWLVQAVLVRRLEPGLSRQDLFRDLVRSAAIGRTLRAGNHTFGPRYASDAGELYRYLLVEYAAWLDAGAPDILWERTR